VTSDVTICRADFSLGLETDAPPFISDIPLGVSISAQERNYGTIEERLWSIHRTDKYLFRQYRVDNPDPELGGILDLTRCSNCPFRTSEFMDPKPIVFYLRRKGWTARDIPTILDAHLARSLWHIVQ
jgi:hypothetical protein